MNKPIQLTPEQEAFLWEVAHSNENIRLDAVAGSGKTTTLLRASECIPHGMNAIALAFNKRIQEDLAAKFPSNVTCKTFNGLGHGILTRRWGRPKLNARKMGEITSQYCKERGLGDYWHEIKAMADQLKKSGLVPLDRMDELKYKAGVADWENMEALASHHDLKLNEVIGQAAMEILDYSIHITSTGLVDFDDQIYMTTYFISEKYWPRFDYILVDEAQDLSQMQHDMIHRLMHEESRIIVVGDPHQAIYGWRGASSASMDELSERFHLKKMPLSVCFRCPKDIVLLAQHEVPHIQPRPDAPKGTVTNLLNDWKPQDLKLGSVVLCRNNAPLVGLTFELLRAGMPAYFCGKDLGATLKRALKNVGEGTLGAALRAWRDEQVDKALAKDLHDKADMIEDTYETLETIRQCAQAKDKKALIRGIDYLFRTEYSEDAIELSTIHRSKGKEWNTVYFLNSYLIPGRWVSEAYHEGKACGQWMMEQEDNLRYVATTRSLNELVFIERSKRNDPD